MNFDKRKVYTAVNADELHEGDLVFATDILSWLRTEVEGAEKEYDPMPIAAIKSEEAECRFSFSVGEADTVDYALVYLVCPARNAEAYRAWQQGKAVEMQLSSDDCWTSVVPDFPKTMNDFWFRNNVRVKQKKPPAPSYRPYESVSELVSDFKKRFDTHTPKYAMPLIWVKKRGNSKKTKLITAFNERENLVYLDGGEVYDMDGLYKDYIFLDGTPCGVKE